MTFVMALNESGLISLMKSSESLPGSSVKKSLSYWLTWHLIPVDASTQWIIPLTFCMPSGVTPFRVSGYTVHFNSTGSWVSGSLTISSQLTTYANLSLTMPPNNNRLKSLGTEPSVLDPSGPSKSKKSERSIKRCFPNGTTRFPSSSIFGWRAISRSSIADPPQFVNVIFNGSSTQKALTQTLSISSRMQSSNTT